MPVLNCNSPARHDFPGNVVAIVDSLDRPKPFRRFKDALCDFPEIRQAWFGYEAEQLRKIAEDYYESEGIHVEWKSG